MTSSYPRVAASTLFAALMLFSPVAVAKGGGNSGSAAVSRGVNRLEAPVLRDHRGGNANQARRPRCERGNHTHTPDGGCTTAPSGTPVVRDHRQQ